MTIKTSNILFYTGLFLLTVGTIGLTFAAFLAIVGLPVFAIGISLVLFSKRTWKWKLITVGGFVVAIFAFWPIWKAVNTVGPEVILIPENYRGKANIIFTKNCGSKFTRTDEGRIYEIPEDGVLILNEEQKYGFIDHTYYLVDKKGNRTKLPKMDVSDFNKEGDIEIKPNEPSRDQLGVFYWGRTGNTESSVHGLKYSYQEFYVSTYSDLYKKYGPEFDMDFNSVRDKKIQQCE